MNTRYGGGGQSTPTFYNPYDATFQYSGMNTNNANANYNDNNAMYDSQVDETMNYGGIQGDETMNYGGGGGYERNLPAAYGSQPALDSPSSSVYGRKFPSFEASPSSDDQIYAQSSPSSLSEHNFNENYYPYHGRVSPLGGEKKPASNSDGDESFSRSPFNNKRAPMLRGEPSFGSFPLKSDHDLTYGQVQVP